MRYLKAIRNLKIINAALIIIIAALIVMIVMQYSGNYPKGSDVYGHLFKANVLYNSINSGDIYPLYTDLWYNGQQLFRYWPPMAHYVLALMQFIEGGNILNAYVLFIGLSFIIGGSGWLIFGIIEDRIALGAIIAVMYFFLPDNMRVCFSEGNVPRIFITALIPYVFLIVWQIIYYKRKKYIIPLVLLMCVIIFTHIMIAAMIGIGTFLFCLIYSLANKEYKYSVYTILSMVLCFAIMGIELVPGLIGGMASMDSEAAIANMAGWSEKASISLNPFLRIKGEMDLYYFGASILFTAFLGFLLCSKEINAGFIAAALIFFGTTKAFVPIVKLLPLKQAFWMERFTPIAYCLLFISLMMWKKSKKIFIYFLVILIAMDCIPSLKFFEFDKDKIVTAQQGVINNEQRYLLKEGRAITENRFALMDLSTYGAFPSYIMSENYDDAVKYVFGWAHWGSSTLPNIVMINTAFEKGYYEYMFDRLLELGSDTVLIKKNLLKEKDFKKLNDSAAKLNYSLVLENENGYLYKLGYHGTFGTISSYNNIAIGSTSDYISFIYPDFKKGKSININDYSYEELKNYKRIYLSGFTYSNRNEAEKMIDKLGRSGVMIYIDMNGVPVNKTTGIRSFLGIDAFDITFSRHYPEITYKGRNIIPKRFEGENAEWNTVYLGNLKNVYSYADFNGKKLDCIGTGENENIYFIGFNLLYHDIETFDDSIRYIIDDIFECDGSILPKRELVRLDVDYKKDEIIINSYYDNVNTNIAFQDNFRSLKNIKTDNNLIIVDKGTTKLRIVYSYFKTGLIVTVIGIILEIVVLILFIKDNTNDECEEKF